MVVPLNWCMLLIWVLLVGYWLDLALVTLWVLVSLDLFTCAPFGVLDLVVCIVWCACLICIGLGIVNSVGHCYPTHSLFVSIVFWFTCVF